MKSLNRLWSFGLVVSGATLIQFASPVQAAVFDFNVGTSSNSAIKTYSASGITLNASNSNSTGSNPGTLNGPGTSSPLGLCAWTVVGSGIGRCGYGNVNGSGVSRFQLKFDKAVAIESFDVGINELSSGSIAFSLDNSVFTTVSFNTAGTKTLSSLFAAAANQTIFVQTSGTPSGANGGLIRLSSLRTAEAPAPLPLLGAALGFRVSRRIRKRIGLAARQV
jgi:hypothetical protein